MMPLRTILHPSAAALLLLPAGLCAQQDAPTAKELELRGKIKSVQKDTADLRAELLAMGLEVNGKQVSPSDLKRELIFLAGSNLIELKILELIVVDWRDRMIKEHGKDPKLFEVNDADVEAEIKQNYAAFAQKYPGLDFWEAVRAQTGIARERFVHQTKMTKVFNKVFFPGAPDQWPEITAEAIKAASQGSSGKEFWEGLLKQGRDKDGKPREMPAFWMEMIRKMLVQQLKKWSDIKYPADGLKSDLVLTVNDRPWGTAEAFEQIKEGLYFQNLEQAVAELVVREALTQELKDKGVWVSDEDFRAAFAKYREQFDNTLFNTEIIARSFKGYPTLEAFRTRWRLMHCFEKLIAAEFNDDTLQEHANKHSRFFADGKVSVDVIPLMGKDNRTDAWLPNGMAEAKKRADKVMAMIKNGEKTFDQALDAHGEFYTLDKERGRLSNKSLNELRRNPLKESEYNEVLSGYSLGYHLFYTAPVGKVIGPLKGPEAWYICRVTSRSPANQKVDIKNQQTRELVKQDFLTYRFLQWVQEVMNRTTVK